MDLRLMRYFVAVAEELHFGRAARRLHMSQPPLSQQIRALETELRVILFQRTNRRVELTPEGHTFLNRARSILRLADDAKLEMHGIATGESGNFRIGYMSAAMLSNLPPILRLFFATSKNVSISFSELSVAEQLRAASESTIDVGFVDLVGRREAITVDNKILRLEQLWTEEMGVIVAPEHRLAKQERVTLNDLTDEPIISLPRSPFFGFADRVMQLYTKIGKEPRIVQTVERYPEIIALVAANVGVSFAPKSSTSFWLDDVVYLKIDSLPRVDVSIVWSETNTSPLLATFLQRIALLRRDAWPLRGVTS